jgi:hypothetical protein
MTYVLNPLTCRSIVHRDFIIVSSPFILNHIQQRPRDRYLEPIVRRLYNVVVSSQDCAPLVGTGPVFASTR